MRRRAFVRLIGGTAAWPLAARAQQKEMRQIGALHYGASEHAGSRRCVID
jgi:hypothetical protein